MDDEFNVPVQFKGNKCIFLSRVTTRAELETCQNFDMTIHNEWNTDRKISQLSKNVTSYIYHTKHDTVYTYSIPTSNHVHDTYLYRNPSSEKAIFRKLPPILYN